MALIIGAAAGGAGVVAIAGFAFYMFKKKKSANEDEDPGKRTGGAAASRPRTRGRDAPDDEDPVVSVYGADGSHKPSSPYRKRRLVTVRRADGTVDILTVEEDQDGYTEGTLNLPPLMSKGRNSTPSLSFSLISCSHTLIIFTSSTSRVQRDC